MSLSTHSGSWSVRCSCSSVCSGFGRLSCVPPQIVRRDTMVTSPSTGRPGSSIRHQAVAKPSTGPASTVFLQGSLPRRARSCRYRHYLRCQLTPSGPRRRRRPGCRRAGHRPRGRPAWPAQPLPRKCGQVCGWSPPDGVWHLLERRRPRHRVARWRCDHSPARPFLRSNGRPDDQCPQGADDPGESPAGTGQAVRWLLALGRFWYRFLIGDSALAAAGAGVALLLGLLLARSRETGLAQVLLPLSVAGALFISLHRDP